jgi:hypothetical protein
VWLRRGDGETPEVFLASKEILIGEMESGFS